METAKELIEQLNAMDETSRIEAKRGSAINRSLLETICAFSNEPRLEGGFILLGVVREDESLFPIYKTEKLGNLDQLQLDIASQCASRFNQPIRPSIEVEEVSGNPVIKIFVPELPDAQKPVYFKNEGLPRGAYRRIGSSDQRCSDDDLALFYNQTESFDSTIVSASSWDDVDEAAIERYRSLREKVNPHAEELNYKDTDLLRSLGCLQINDKGRQLTFAGLLVFGKSMAQRRLIPSVRVDYIRVPGNEWMADPENRFTTIDMRGPLLLTINRAYNAIVDDLPKGFLLPEGQLQAESVGFPGRALREALVNALMHRSYRVNQPIQIIRYSNRLEIKNPGFSLKPEDSLGEPGSQQRNPFIAAIFHETNLAETKGSGIATMRRLMNAAGLVPPTFESDHANNQFTARLLLHHFLSEEDLVWLNLFDDFALNDDQRKILIFLREAGAVDNTTYRQLSGCDTLKASADLRSMRDNLLLEAKGRGRATYYIPGEVFWILTAPVQDSSAPVQELSAPVQELSAPVTELVPESLVNQLPPELRTLLDDLGQKCRDVNKMQQFIHELCRWRNLKLIEIAAVMSRQPKYVLRKFIQPMLKKSLIKYTFPDMPNHLEQAYTVNK